MAKCKEEELKIYHTREVQRINTRTSGRFIYPRLASKIFDESVETSKSKTEQTHKDDCDINIIVKRYKSTGILGNPNNQTRQPMYGDFTNVEEYQTIQNKLVQAQADFDTLSSDIRAKFNNNPAELVEYLSDASNLHEAQELGIIPTIQEKSVADAKSDAISATSKKESDTRKDTNTEPTEGQGS